MGKLNVTSGGGLRVGPGTAIRMDKMQSIVSLADNKDYIGTAAELAEQYGYKSPATISSAIAILRALGYDIVNHGRIGYVIKSRPDRFPKEFEHFRSGAKVKLPSSNGTQLGMFGDVDKRKDRVSFFRRLANAKNPDAAVLNEDVIFMRKPIEEVMPKT